MDESANMGKGLPCANHIVHERNTNDSTMRITLVCRGPNRLLATSANRAVAVQLIATINEIISPKTVAKIPKINLVAK